LGHRNPVYSVNELITINVAFFKAVVAIEQGGIDLVFNSVRFHFVKKIFLRLFPRALKTIGKGNSQDTEFFSRGISL
jgi:hypothetical protein